MKKKKVLSLLLMATMLISTTGTSVFALPEYPDWYGKGGESILLCYDPNGEDPTDHSHIDEEKTTILQKCGFMQNTIKHYVCDGDTIDCLGKEFDYEESNAITDLNQKQYTNEDGNTVDIETGIEIDDVNVFNIYSGDLDNTNIDPTSSSYQVDTNREDAVEAISLGTNFDAEDITVKFNGEDVDEKYYDVSMTWEDGSEFTGKVDADHIKKAFTIKITGKNGASGSLERTIYVAHNKHTFKRTVTQKSRWDYPGNENDKCTMCGYIDTDDDYDIDYPERLELSKISFKYNGQSQKPSVTIYDQDSKVIAPSNYDVSYSSDTTNPGKKTVTVTFKGEKYEGSVSANYTIEKASSVKAIKITKVKSAKKAFTVKFQKAKKVQIQYSKYKSFKKAKTVTVTNKTSKKIKAKKGKYYVRVRAVSGKNTSSWSAVKTVKAK